MAPTTTSLTSAPNPSFCGEPVVFTAIVTDTSSTAPPTGAVTFFVSENGPAQTVDLTPGPGDFQSTASTAPIVLDTIGEHASVALYISDDPDAFDNSTSSIYQQGVGEAATSVSLSTTPASPFTCGSEVEVCATVANTDVPGNIPTGTVVFTDPAGNPSQPVDVDGTGEACYTFASITTEGDITAQFTSDDACFGDSNDATTVELTPATTTAMTTVTTPGPYFCGSPVEVCVLVANSDVPTNTPTGDVIITAPDGESSVPVPVDENGEACYTFASIDDSGDFTAAYISDNAACFSDSAAPVEPIAITPATTTATTTVTTSGPYFCGSPVEVCVQVANSDVPTNTPTGDVIITAPDGESSEPVPVDENGEACYTFASIGNSGNITAAYISDNTACFAGSSAAPVPIDITPATTTTTVSTTPGDSLFCGETVEVCAAVVNTSVPGEIPTGSVQFTGAGVNETVPLDGSGNACFTTTDLETGTLTATYNSDTPGCVAGSTGTLDVVVAPASTTTTLTLPAGPIVCGESVLVCAQVATNAPGSGTPTGTVQFSGAGVDETVPLDGSGSACFTTTDLETGTITATYNSADSGCFDPSGDSEAVSVDAATTTTTVETTPLGPFVCGQSVEVCATVANLDVPGNTPTGSVQFTGAGVSQTVTLDGSGQACLTTTALITGTITAAYTSDDADCFDNSSGGLNVDVDPAPTTTELTVSPSQPVCGESVTLCADVSVNMPGTGTPTGTVNFSGPGVNQNVPLVAGQACITTSILSSGTVTATYTSDTPACFADSADTTGVTVVSAETTTSISTIPAGSSFVCGQSVQVCVAVATVAPGSGTPTGTVFLNGAGLNETVPLVGGQACTTTTALTTGTIVATYSSDAPACFADSTGTAGITVNAAATTTDLTVDPQSSICGESVEVCATVTTDPPGSGTPTGSVQFTGPGVNQTIPLVDGQACLTTTEFATGTVTANYVSGSQSCFANSSDSQAVTVNASQTTTTVTASPSTSVCGQSVEICVAVEAVTPVAGTPSGSVLVTGPGGVSETLPLNASGEACFTTTQLASGTVTAAYTSDAPGCFAPSNGSTGVTVDAASTTTDVTATPATSNCGQSVQVCATVTTDTPGSGTPTGTVQFTGPGGLNENVPLVGGQACFTSTTLVTGTITATYLTDNATCFASSSDTFGVTVNAAPSTTTVAATPSTSVCGQQVTLCATVTSSGGTPTGAVSFTGPGGSLGNAVLVDGQACITVSNLSTGTVTATYAGTSCFASSSGSTSVTVTPVSTTTVVTATPNPVGCGQPVQLCASVTTNAPGSGTPDGSVLFTGPGGFSQSATLVGGLACVTVPAAAAGTYSAAFTSSVPACFANSSGSVTVTGTQSPSTTTVTATPNPSACGQSVTVCATVAPTGGGTVTPTGTVVFTGPGGLNQTVALSGGQACFTSSSLVAGTITATYSGDSCFLGSSGSVSIVSNPVATTITVQPTQIRRRSNGQLVIQTMNATLRDSATMAPIAGQTVVFRANTSGGPLVFGSAVTNASGVATLAPPTFVVPVSTVTASTYTASFAGAACLSPSSGTSTLTFVPVPSVP